MHACYINLDSAADRRHTMQAQIAACALPFPVERLAALRGSDFPQIVTTASAGQLGCMLSHLLALKNAAARRDDLLVIEDDAAFTGQLSHCLGLVESLPRHAWDLLYLDATIVEVEDYLALTRQAWANFAAGNRPSARPVAKTAHFFGTHAYVANRESLPRLIALLEHNLRAGLALDNVYAAATAQGYLRAWHSVPFLCGPGQQTGESQISAGQHPHLPNWVSFRQAMYEPSLAPEAVAYLQSLQQVSIDVIAARLGLGLLPTFDPDQHGRLQIPERAPVPPRELASAL